MANVKSLQTKKANLTEKLAKIETTTAEKIASLSKVHDELIQSLKQKHTDRIASIEEGIVGQKERLVEEITVVDTELQNEVGALQAQIDAIRGTATVVESDEVL